MLCVLGVWENNHTRLGAFGSEISPYGQQNNISSYIGYPPRFHDYVYAENRTVVLTGYVGYALNASYYGSFINSIGTDIISMPQRGSIAMSLQYLEY